MKKIISIIMCLCIIFITLTFTGISALADTKGYYTYTVSNGKATITKCNTSISGDITIPSELGGYPVTSIGSESFRYCYSLTSVTIPNSVTSIGEASFQYGTSLTNINVDENNENYCDIDGVLFNKEKTVLIQYPNGNARTRYTIPNSVTSIGDRAFYECTSLTRITLGNSVTSIGNHAFEYCRSLKSVIIPDSITSIGNYAFYTCTSLTSINVNENNENYCDIDGVLFNKDKTILIQYPIGRTASTYSIPNSVISISEAAFFGCESLTRVTIPDSVISIGSDVFSLCGLLASVTIGNSVTSIGSGAFSMCGLLTSVTIPDSVTSIGSDAFCFCESLTSVTIGNSVTSIGDRAFESCTSLTEMYILNKDCTIYDSSYTINTTANIYGYAGSTAERYSIKHSRTFVVLNNPVIIDNQVVNTDNSESGFALPEITKDKGLLYFDGENYYKSGDKIPADKGGNIKTVTYESEMESGASARLDHEAGLRFYTQIDKNLTNNLKAMGFKVEFGTLIAPKDLLNGEELSFDLSEEKYIDVKYTSDVFYKDDTGFEGVVGSLVNIKEKNIAREFVGRGYIKVIMNGNTKIIYSDYCKGDADNNSRSVAFVADKIKNESSSSDLYKKYKDLIDKWAGLYKK